MRRSGVPDKALRARTSPWVAQNRCSGLRRAFGSRWERLSVDHGRTSPAGLPSIVAVRAHAARGGGFGLS
jgi:hypothetical protein